MVVRLAVPMLMLLTFAFAQPKRAEVSQSLVGKPAPGFDLELSSGKRRFSLESAKGKTVVLAFWATWCEPCRAEIPRLMALQKDYAAKGVVVLGVSSEDAREVLAYLSSEDPDFATVLDPGKHVSNAYGVDMVPRTFVVDSTGTIRKMIRGVPGEASLRRAIDATLH
jgi:peroxiredoxin